MRSRGLTTSTTPTKASTTAILARVSSMERPALATCGQGMKMLTRRAVKIMSRACIAHRKSAIPGPLRSMKGPSMISCSASGMSKGSLPTWACRASRKASPATPMEMEGSTADLSRMPAKVRDWALMAATSRAMDITGSTLSITIISRLPPT